MIEPSRPAPIAYLSLVTLVVAGCTSSTDIGPGAAGRADAAQPSDARRLDDDGFAPARGQDGGDSATDSAAGDISDVMSDAVDASDTRPCDRAVTVGGGPAYIDQRKCASKRTYCSAPDEASVVSDAAQLRDALDSATAGDVVYVQADATIDVTDHDPFVIPEGVTLASNRGCGDAKGGRLRDDDPGILLKTGGPNVAVFGLRLRGYGHSKTPEPRDSPDAIGIRITHPNADIGNNKVSNFVFMCVQVDKGGSDAHIHHNDITFCNRPGYGYTVAVYHEVPVIEYNFIDHYRHAIAVGGRNNLSEDGYGGYIARYNIAGKNRLGHAFDVHGEGDSCGQWCGGTAGSKVIIHHNTFLPGDKYNSDYRSQDHISIRGVPEQTAQIYNNWFKGNVLEAYKFSQGATHGPPYNGQRYENITFHDNHWTGTTPSSCQIGAPRKACLSP